MKHHRFLLRLHLQQINALEAAVSEIDREVNERIEPFRTAVELLITIRRAFRAERRCLPSPRTSRAFSFAGG